MNRAAELWLRASELLPPGPVTADNSEEAAGRLRKAAILADSARQHVSLARQQAEAVRRASREAGPGVAFRLSVLYEALDGYVRLVMDDAGDHYLFYSKSEASARAVLQGDAAEAEIQQNVAMSYLRRSEERQAAIRRRLQQAREALANIGDSGR